MGRRTAEETREHILSVARNLFYWNGIRATGVDHLAATAGIAPTSLYRAFPSKEDLVAAYIDHGDLDSRANFEAAVIAEPDPRERILSVFRGMADLMRPEICRGCSSQMALAEYPDADTEPHRRAREAKDWLLKRYIELASAFCADRAPEADPALLANQLFIMHEGVVASALSGRSDRFVETGVALVETLLRAAECTPPLCR
jgi:AcrR family transcriptional regulator